MNTRLSKPFKIYDVQGAGLELVYNHQANGVYKPDMIRFSSERLQPVSSLPESEAFHVGVVVSHRRVSIRSAFQIKIHKLFQIRPDNLVRVDKYNLLEVHREQNIEEENLVCPNNALFLCLRT